MAEMYGVKITSLKPFVGMEGLTMQGNVRLNGKKLGFWSQDPNGGICDMYDFDTSLLKEAVQKYFNSQPADWQYRDLYTDDDGNMTDDFVDVFMYELANLCMDEKEWNKHRKKGYPIMVHYHNAPPKDAPRAVPITKTLFVNSKYLWKEDNDIKYLLRDECGVPEPVLEKVYRRPADFVIE